jgi:hypothetical protein
MKVNPGTRVRKFGVKLNSDIISSLKDKEQIMNK